MKAYKYFIIFLISVISLNSYSQDVKNESKLDSNKVLWNALLSKEEKSAVPDSQIVKAVWADKVIKYSSQYSKTEKSAKQALGAPNVLPIGGDAKTAWAVKSKGGKEASGTAYIYVGFSKPMRISQVAIAESFNPGAITRVVIKGQDQEKEIYKAEPKALGIKSRMLNIFLPAPTDFYVDEVDVYLEPEKVVGWNEIDAIGITDEKDSVKAYINLVPNLKFSGKPESLGENINTIYDEIAPMISPDGKTIYFDRKNSPENAGGFQDIDDIWYSVVDKEGKWRPAKNIGQPLNNKYNNFVQSITPDGNSLLLGNVYKKDGTAAVGVSLTHRTRQGWAFPEKQYIDNFINYNDYANYFLSNDGKVLLMAIQTKDSRGGLDLYVSFRKSENNWTKPQNLGDVVNTMENDYSPFLAADGVTLYYSTSGKAGYGSEDIFMTTRLDDTWENWSEPQNLGHVINSPKSDTKYNVPASGQYAYFSSTHNSVGKNDIFRIALPKTIKPKPVVLISGRVLNNKTNQPVDARIIVEELPSGKEVAFARTDPKTGKFKIVLPAGKKYGFRAVGLGFFDINKNIDLSDINEYEEIEDETMRLAPIEVGSVVRLNNIFFETAKATLKPESFPELDRTIDFLNKNKTLQIEIAGHTDNVGSDALNMKLSKARAQSVATYLVEHGIETTRLIVKGYGETRPIAFNTTPEGRQQNRRVEFKVLKK